MKEIINAHRFTDLNQFKKSLNNSYLNYFESFQQQLIFKSKSEIETLNIIYETRARKKQKHLYLRLRILLGFSSRQEKMVILLNYRFSKLGDFCFENNKAIPKASVETFFEFWYLTSQECLKVQLRINPYKTQGPSKIPSWLLRYGAVRLAEPVTFPSSLKKANITPLFKKDDTEDQLNYRPIIFFQLKKIIIIYEKIVSASL